MNSNLDSAYIQLTTIIDNYLSEFKLARIACITNVRPSRQEKKYLSDRFYYIRYCVRRLTEKIMIHFIWSKLDYRKIGYDVFQGEIEDQYLNHVFSYISLRLPNIAIVREKLSFITANKTKINPLQPILVKIICDDDDPNTVNLPKTCKLLQKLSPNESVYKII